MARINQRCGFVKPFLRRSNIGAFLPARTEVKKTFGGSSANCPAKVSTQVRDYSSSQRDAGDQPVVEPPAKLHRASGAKTCVETLAVQFARFVHSLLDRRLSEQFALLLSISFWIAERRASSTLYALIPRAEPPSDRPWMRGAQAGKPRTPLPQVTQSPPARSSTDRSASGRTANFPPIAWSPTPRPVPKQRPARPTAASRARPIAEPGSHSRRAPYGRRSRVCAAPRRKTSRRTGRCRPAAAPAIRRKARAWRPA